MNFKKTSFISIFLFFAIILTSIAPARAAEGKLPEVKDCKTSEICVLSLGAATDCVALGSENTPAFPSNGPSSFAFDKLENLYIADAMNFRVLIVSKEGKVIKAISYPQSETSNKNDAYFIRDIAVSPKDNNIYLLNATLKTIFIVSIKGDVVGEVNIKEQVKSPHRLFVANDGKIYVRDEEDNKVVIYSPDGKVFGRLAGSYVSEYPDANGCLFSLGEFDKEGRDILLMDPLSKIKPRVFAKLIKTIKETDPYDYQIIGVDKSNNFYASIVEKIAEDVIQTMFYKFSPDGKVVSRTRVMPFKLLGHTMPTRYFTVSPKGSLFGITTSDKYDKFVIVRVE